MNESRQSHSSNLSSLTMRRQGMLLAARVSISNTATTSSRNVSFRRCLQLPYRCTYSSQPGTSSTGSTKESARSIAKRMLEQQQQQQTQGSVSGIGSSTANGSMNTSSLSEATGAKIAQEMNGKSNRAIAENAMKEWSKKTAGSTVSGAAKGVAGLATIGAVGFWLGFTESGSSAVDEAKHMITHNSVADAIHERFVDPIVQPVRDKLLPDFPEGIEPFPTLVLDLEDTLVHMEWDRKYGWRVVKRPGLDAFLMRMAQSGYEIVLFTSGVFVNLETTVAMVSHLYLYCYCCCFACNRVVVNLYEIAMLDGSKQIHIPWIVQRVYNIYEWTIC